MQVLNSDPGNSGSEHKRGTRAARTTASAATF